MTSQCALTIAMQLLGFEKKKLIKSLHAWSRLVSILNQIKSSLYSPYYAAACNELRGHLRGLAPGLHSSEEASQRWRDVGDTVPI